MSPRRSTETCGNRGFRVAEDRFVYFMLSTRRTAILLIAGDKTGDKRFYDHFVPPADRLYDEHLEEIRKESGSHGRQAQIRGASRTDAPAAQKRAAGKAERLSKEMDLAELRRARSQEKLAQALRIGQAAVAKRSEPICTEHARARHPRYGGRAADCRALC